MYIANVIFFDSEKRYSNNILFPPPPSINSQPYLYQLKSEFMPVFITILLPPSKYSVLYLTSSLINKYSFLVKDFIFY